VLAKSLRLTGTKHVIACMITSNVSVLAQDELHKFFDAVHVVDYYRAEVTRLKTDKTEQRYGSWMSISLTWYQALKLEQYKKVLLLDSDVAILRNIDHLFQLQTPAGCFHSFWKSLFYGWLRHGDKVSSDCIMKALDTKESMYVAIGNGLLLSPRQANFALFDA
jgi:alpha-N-acetylglucosamine transferase